MTAPNTMTTRVAQLVLVAEALDGLRVVAHRISVGGGYIGADFLAAMVDLGISEPADFSRACDAFGLGAAYGQPGSNAYRDGTWQGIHICAYTNWDQLAAAGFAPVDETLETAGVR